MEINNEIYALKKQIYHRFYKRYGYVTGIKHSYDMEPKTIYTTVQIQWESDSRGIALPENVDPEDIEFVDFKHHIRQSNDRANGR